MNAAVRPHFVDGERLTAARLNEAVEYLRNTLRRVLLAPLSPGAATGLELQPVFAALDDELIVSPGVAIDGKGRLLILPEERRFSVDEIAAAAGITARDQYVRVCLALDENAPDPCLPNAVDPCAQQLPVRVVENVRFVFEEFTAVEAFEDAFANLTSPSCVQAWEDLDGPGPSSAECCVTLGHVKFEGGGTALTATDFLREGVTPRFSAIRNSLGTASIFLGQLRFNIGALAVDEPGVAVPVTTVFGPKPVAFFGPTGGTLLQATHVAPFGALFAAGTYGGGPAVPSGTSDERVFAFAGGAGDFDPATQVSEVPAGLAGVSAVPCELDPANGTVAAAGEPLLIAANAVGSSVRVLKYIGVASGYEGPAQVLGVSAGRSYDLPDGRIVVPVATAGVVKATVQKPNADELKVGTELTLLDSAGKLFPELSGGPVVARAAQAVPSGVDEEDIFVWVQHPPVIKP